MIEHVRLYRPGPDGLELAQATRREGEQVHVNGIVEEVRTLPFPVRVVQGSLSQGRMIPAGQTDWLLRVSIPYSPAADSVDQVPMPAGGPDATKFPPREVARIATRYSLDVCYCSVYGENCNRITVGASLPEDAAQACGG